MNSLFRLTPVSLAVTLSLFSMLGHAEDTSTIALESDAEDLDTLVVEGDTEEQSSTANNFSYVSDVAQTATKSDEEIVKIPRAVSVVTQEQMDDRAPISISDALQYTPSIQTNFYGEDNKQDWFVVRGFKQANNGLYQDGTRLYSSGFYSWQIDPFMLERIEILRGPASTLNGQTPPGGVINVISKRAQLDEDFGAVTGSVGSYDRKEINLDVNKLLNDKMAFRMVALTRENGTKVDGVEAERTLLAPSLAWQISDKTNLTILASYQKDDSDPYVQFLPKDGTLTTDSGTIDYDMALGDPDWETFQREQTSVGYELEHIFNEDLKFQQSARFSHMDINVRQMYYLTTLSSSSSIIRGVTYEDGESDALNLDNRFIYDFDTGSIKHTLLTGLDYQSLDKEGQNFGSTTPLASVNGSIFFNPFNPTYGDTSLVRVTNLSTLSTAALTDDDLVTTKTKNRQLGFYVQDKAELTEQLTLLAGLRYDDVSNETHIIDTNTKTDVDIDAWTSNVGASYDLGMGVVTYANFAQSFTPINSFDENNDPADPERANSYEVGVKFKPQNFDGQFGVAAYQVTKENLTSGSSGTSSFQQIGEVRNRGIEFEAVANLNQAFTLVGTLSSVDSEVTEDDDSSKVGKTPQQIADRLASVWGNYRFMDGILDGLKVGAGVRYIGDSYGDDKETIKVPSYTLFDAMANYQWNDYKFQIMVKNLFDKEYVSTCSTTTSDALGDTNTCYYGDSRNIIASVSYDW